MKEQLVGFLRGGSTVMAGDGNRDVIGNDTAFERILRPQDAVGAIDGIGTWTFGDAESHGRLVDVWTPSGAVSEEDILGRLFARVLDGGGLAQVNGPVF